MKIFASLGVALAVIGLASAASAQTRVKGPHAETGAVLICLLQHQHDECGGRFSGSARSLAQNWLFWGPDKDFKLGALVSADFVGTQAVNAYLTRFLNGRAADVYDVKFKHQEMTFYIVPPDADGKVEFMRIRGGAPDDIALGRQRPGACARHVVGDEA